MEWNESLRQHYSSCRIVLHFSFLVKEYVISIWDHGFFPHGTFVMLNY